MDNISGLQTNYLYYGIQNPVSFTQLFSDNSLSQNYTSPLKSPDQLFVNFPPVLKNMPLVSFDNIQTKQLYSAGLTLTEVSSTLGKVPAGVFFVNDVNQFKVSSIILDTPTVSKISLANTAQKVAKNKNTVGWCFSGVGEAVSKSIEPFLRGQSAYMAADQLAKHPKFREIQVKPENLPKLSAGAIVVWNKTPQNKHGHISVSLGNGYEASDHVQKQATSLGGSKNFRVFVPIS